MDERRKIFEESFRTYFRCITKYVDDPRVSRIFINGYREIWIEIDGERVQVGEQFDYPEELDAGIRNLSQYAGGSVSGPTPLLTARLPNGSRVQAIMPPYSPGKSLVTITRRIEWITTSQLVENHTISSENMQELIYAIRKGLSILIVGGESVGKSTLLGSLLTEIPKEQRVIVVEELHELDVRHPHTIRLENHVEESVKGAGNSLTKDKSFLKLVDSALGLHPDWLVIGELGEGIESDIVRRIRLSKKPFLGTMRAIDERDAMERLGARARDPMRASLPDGIDIIVEMSSLQVKGLSYAIPF